jgi:5-methylcytosine-specific restriction endonuclease McrA
MTVDVLVPTKRCGDCGRELPLSSFHRDVHRRLGVARWCKECACARARVRYAKDRPVVRQRQAIYYSAHREQIAERQAGYLQTEIGADLRREANRRRRARLREVDVREITLRDISRLTSRYGGLCAYCRTAPFEDLDHVIPLHLGGRHSIGNLLPACGPCNNSKYVSLIVEWKARLR